MRILVTGGAGFQGSHLADLWLSSGHDVTILNTFSQRALQNTSPFANRAQIVWGSVTDEEVVDKTVREHDVVVHLAARVNVDESIGSPRSFLDVNVTGTWNVLEAVRKSGARLIYSSTCEVYGSVGPLTASERIELRPRSPYAASKAAADRLCFAYHTTHEIDVTIVRPCNIYGERQKSGSGGAVIPIFVESALAGSPLTIFGDGSQQREYMNIDDLVRAYDLVLTRSDLAGETINFGSGEMVSIKQIARFIVAQLGGSIEYGSGRRGELPGFKVDSTVARQLGFSPTVGFKEGLDRFIRWRQQQAHLAVSPS